MREINGYDAIKISSVYTDLKNLNPEHELLGFVEVPENGGAIRILNENEFSRRYTQEDENRASFEEDLRKAVRNELESKLDPVARDIFKKHFFER